MPPEFSIILPTRGDSARLRAALASALVSPLAKEVIIGHDRRSGEAALGPDLTSDPRVLVATADRPGPAAARNAALHRADFRMVAFLDDDDIWLPGHLSQAGEMLAANPDVGLIAGDAYEFLDRSTDGADVPLDASTLPRFRPARSAGAITSRDLILDSPVLTPTVVVRQDALGDSRFPEDLATMEDNALWLELAGKTRLFFDPRPSVIVRRRAHSASRDLRNMAECALEVLRREAPRAVTEGQITNRELRAREGRLWHDLSYACLVNGDRPGLRHAVRESIARVPLLAKNYLYLLLSWLPAAVVARVAGREDRC